MQSDVIYRKSGYPRLTNNLIVSFAGQLQKALPAELLTKFQELEQNEALKLANIENLFT